LRPRFFLGIGGLALTGLLCANAGQREASAGPQPAAVVTGWYNGDWQPGLPSQPNWFFKEGEFSRVYDDFVVPPGGWTVVGVFSNNHMDFSGVTKAAWEIRRDMAPGKGGKKVASGLSRATQVPIPDEGPSPGDPSAGYRIQVDGLHVRLAPGRYWLSVAPVGRGGSVRGGQWYADATLGKNALGDPPGNNGRALVTKTTFGIRFADAGSLSPPGRFGKAQGFSQGVIIDAASGNKGH